MNEQSHNEPPIESEGGHIDTAVPNREPVDTGVAAETVSRQTAWELITGSLTSTWHQPRLIGWYLLMYIASILAFMVPLGVSLGIVDGSGYTGTSIGVGVVLALAGVVAGVTLMIANTAAVLYSVVQPEPTSYWNGWRLGWPNVWSLLVLSFVSSLTLVTGFTLLIIPGIALAGYVILSQIVFATEGKRGTAALVRSTQLIYGAWWGTMGRVLLAMLVVLAVTFAIEFVTKLIPGSFGDMLAVVAGYLVQGFFVVFFITAMYRWYQERAAAVPATPWPEVQRLYIIAVWIGALFMIALPLLGGALVFSQLQSEMMWSNTDFESMLEAELETSFPTDEQRNGL